MVRLHLTVEGQSEQAFCSRVLAPHLAGQGVFLQKPRLCRLHRCRRGRIPHGGLLSTFQHTLDDIKRWLREDRSADARFSMMVDLYGLPADFPGFADARTVSDPFNKVHVLENALASEVDDSRFIPYLSLHEFEALILTSVDRLHDFFPNENTAITGLIGECSKYPTPEHINDGQHSHPKARAKRYLAEYQENIDGPLLTERIGLSTKRARCQHCAQWIANLEQLDSPRQ